MVVLTVFEQGNRMFGFLNRRRKAEREDFEFFLHNRYLQNPSLNLEDALDQYIQEYGVAVRHSLDEPAIVTNARTKLHIIEESALVDPKYYHSDEQFQHYLEALRRIVKMYDSLTPEVLKRMKEREQ